VSVSQRVEMEGALRLEGVFLESIFAAYAISKGLQVVPRPETEGQQHDVLLEGYNGFIHCECTGLAEITGKKIERFYNDTMMLHDKLLRKYNKGLVEAWFVAATHDEAWTSEASEEFQKVKKLLKERLNIDTRLISSSELLLELLRSGILGVRLVKDRIYWASPEDVAIRYNPAKKEFTYDHCDKSVLDRFKETHFSLLPSYYWDSYYKSIFEEAVKDKMELPLSVFTYYDSEGLRWRSLADLIDCYESYLKSFRRAYVLEKGRDFILVLWESRRKNEYYWLHIFTLGDQKSTTETKYISSTLLSELKGRAYLLTEDLKTSGKIPKEASVSINIVSPTQYWSLQAWGMVPEVPASLKEEIRAYHMAGNELLQDLLSMGVLGFRFRSKNEVTLVGPGIEAIRRAEAGELQIRDKPWYG